MFKKVLLIVALAMGVTSVLYAQKMEKVEVKVAVDYMESSARYLEPSQCVMTTPLLADLKVIGTQISYTEKDAFKDIEVTESSINMVPTLKKIALCRAARAYNADMIIGAMVDVITNANHRFEITITGYPARYANFRNATADDVELVKRGLAVSFGNDGEVLGDPSEKAKVYEENKIE